jgi:proliferating cell nuclear antigen
MQIKINDKKKKDMFVSIFQVLKNCSTLISVTFEHDLMHIQGMDKTHICLFDVKIREKWFNEYSVIKTNKICFDSSVFHSIISIKSDNQDLIIRLDEDEDEEGKSDILHITFISEELKKGDFKKSFKMPLMEYEYEEMNIPSTDYDAEFSLSSKQITDMFSQLSNFGSDIIINCTEEDINLNTNGVTGEMRVDIPIDDLSSYSIVEGEEIKLTYSLNYINKMCITNKLSSDIEFSLSNDRPMKISYNLGDDSLMVFYIAPKMNE